MALACVSLVNLYTWSITLPGQPNLLLGYQEVILINTSICFISIRNWDILTITVNIFKFKYRYWVFMNWWSALFVLNQVNDRLYCNVVNLWQATITNFDIPHLTANIKRKYCITKHVFSPNKKTVMWQT